MKTRIIQDSYDRYMVQRKYKWLPFIWFDDAFFFERWYETLWEAKKREREWHDLYKYKKIKKILPTIKDK